MMNYVIARNAGKRPTLQHAITARNYSTAACGVSMTGWSRVYSDTPIEVLLCLRCARITHYVIGARRLRSVG